MIAALRSDLFARCTALRPMVREFVQRGLDEDPLEQGDADAILDAAYAADVLVLYADDEARGTAFGTMELVQTSRGVVAHVLTLSGQNMAAWLDDLIESALLVCAQQGCKEIIVSGRPGWARALRHKQFKPVRTLLMRRVDR